MALHCCVLNLGLDGVVELLNEKVCVLVEFILAKRENGVVLRLLDLLTSLVILRVLLKQVAHLGRFKHGKQDF